MCLIRLMISMGLVFAAGCAQCREAPEFRSQSISTDRAVRVDIALTDESTVQMLVGARKETDMPKSPENQTKQAGAAMGVIGEPAGHVTFTNVTGFNISPAPVVQSGFLYIVRPPTWPMIRTPATRGGPTVTEVWTGKAYAGASVDGAVQRIFFLGAFNTDGTIRKGARMKVEDFPAHASNPEPVFIEVGQYVEARLVGPNLEIVVPDHLVTDPACPQDVRDLIIQMRQYAEQHNMPWNPAIGISGSS